MAVVGNYNIDLVMAHLDSLPPWGTEAVVPFMDVRTAGAAGYSGMALARLALAPICLGQVGGDAHGRRIREELAVNGADVRGLLELEGVPTGLCVAAIRPDGQRAFITYPGHLDLLTAEALRDAERTCTGFDRVRYVLLTGYFLLRGLGCEATRGLFEHWREMGKAVLLDVGWDPGGWEAPTVAEVRSLLPLVDVFLPNEDESRALTGETEPVEAARVLASCGAGIVVVKLGAQGSLVFDAGHIWREPGVPTDVFDTTGAGDAFNSAVIYGLVNRWAWPRILAFANRLCAIVVSRRENRFPGVDEVLP